MTEQQQSPQGPQNFAQQIGLEGRPPQLSPELSESFEEFAARLHLPEAPIVEPDAMEQVKDGEMGELLSSRWDSLGETFRGAKKVIGKIAGRLQHRGIAADGQPIGWIDNARVNLKMLRAYPSIARANERTGTNNYDKALGLALHQVRGRNLENRYNPKEPNKIEMAQLLAYELASFSIFRMIGVEVLRGATQTINPESSTAKWAANRAEVYEQMLHNPTVRRLKGYTRGDTKDLVKANAGVVRPKGIDRLGPSGMYTNKPRPTGVTKR